MTDPNPSPSAPPPRRNWADLGPRLASAAVLIALTVVTLLAGGYFFSLVVGLVFAGVYREFELMVGRGAIGAPGWAICVLLVIGAFAYVPFGFAGVAVPTAIAILIALSTGGERPWRLGGIAVMALTIYALLALRASDYGVAAGVYLGLVIWCTDSAAFFTGRQVGGEKLAPEISPSKTWSGALGGLALGTVAGSIAWFFLSEAPLFVGILMSMLLSVVGQAGDLCESAIKRRFRIKDSGDIIPGHGGLLDRLDSLIAGALFVLVLGLAHGGPAEIARSLLIW